MKQKVVLAAIFLTFSSCGIGKKMVKDLNFVTEKVNLIYYTGFDAKVDLGGVPLPPAYLPIHAPKHPEVTLGYLKLDEDSNVSVRIDLEAATRVNVLDGKLLPNGKPIPITLPDGVLPIAFPVKGSNSMIYLAIGAKSIMAGTAIALKAAVGGKLGDLLKNATSLFFPFDIGPTVKGSVGAYSGSAFGFGVFAVKDLTPVEKKMVADGTGIVHTMSFSGEEPSFEPQTQMPSRKKAWQFYNSVSTMKRYELD